MDGSPGNQPGLFFDGRGQAVQSGQTAESGVAVLKRRSRYYPSGRFERPVEVQSCLSCIDQCIPVGVPV